MPRLWRLPTDLQIHFDQGLHSLAIWNIWHEHKFSLLGHQTDTDGIWHGPLYYWLMTPSFILSRGDPAGGAIFQALLTAVGMFVLADVGRRMFNFRVAWLATLLYACSYGYISYSRWLSNVTPIFPFSILFIWLTWRVWAGESRYFPWAGFLASVITQMDGALGVFLYPWLVVLEIRGQLWKNWKIVGLTLIALVLPHLPTLVFEMRHQWVITHAVLRMSGDSSQGLGWSGKVILANLQTLFKEVYHLTSYTWPWLTSLMVLVMGVYAGKFRRDPTVKFCLAFIAIFFGGVALYQRGAISFFFVPVFAVITLLTAAALSKLKISLILVLLLLIVNIYQWQDFLAPSHALTPIGTANLITNQDRKNVVDWIYNEAQGQPFAVWIYTIPYLLDEPWVYYFKWYGKNKYGYQPTATSGFSPTDLKNGELFFAIYEPDDDRPFRLQAWQENVATNFGQTAAGYNSHDAWVELHR